MNGVIVTLAGIVLATTFVGSTLAETVSGTPWIIDGDTIAIGPAVIRLHGVDAPETGQSCADARDRPYRCGIAALDGLRGLIGSKTVACQAIDRDRYDRLIATCRTGEMDLNAEMVRRGLAIAYRRFSDDYLAEEIEAQNAQRGLWSGTFEAPEAVRDQLWNDATVQAPHGCPIKGNISDRGRIYHTPWSQYYARTRINTARGERWFCSEAEAKAAGWRPPYR
ncbi:MAG: thermonuclease family protein [Pseudomonadota bacterium]